MTSHQFAVCKAITRDLLDRPLNASFSKPIDTRQESLSGYSEVVDRPMDLGTIDAKLTENAYATPHDWYTDVCLVYQNALRFHAPGTAYHQIAEYNLAEFQKMAIGFNCSDPQHWYDMVNIAMAKLSRTIASGPVPQGIDPLILSIIKKAGSMLPPTPQLIADLVERVNTKLDDEIVKYDLLSLLKETEPDLKMEGDKVSIDADSLSELTLNALLLYLKSHN
jgi:hypothetical protein